MKTKKTNIYLVNRILELLKNRHGYPIVAIVASLEMVTSTLEHDITENNWHEHDTAAMVTDKQCNKFTTPCATS